MPDIRTIPERIAYLSFLLIHNRIDLLEFKELDNWAFANNENRELFNDLIDIPVLSYADLTSKSVRHN